MGKIRTFIAIELPAHIRPHLAQQIKDLEIGDANQVKWVLEEKLHVTVKFLGDIDSSKLNDIKQVIAPIAGHTGKIELSLTQLGAFPNLRRPRVIWMGMQKSSELYELHRKLDLGLNKIGFSLDDRKYAPHITLGRVKRYADQHDLTTITKSISESKPERMDPFLIDTLTLFKSELTRSGPVYTPIYQGALGSS